MKFVKVQNSDGPDRDWTPGAFHAVFHEQSGPTRNWWYTSRDGIHVLGEDKARRSRGTPSTLEFIVDSYGEMLYAVVCNQLGADLDRGLSANDLQVLLAAIIAAETKGLETAGYYNSSTRDYSFGVARTYTVQADKAIRRIRDMFVDPPSRSIPKGGKPSDWKEYLDMPRNSMLVAAAEVLHLNRRFRCKGDPVLLYAAYTKGLLLPSKRHPWGMQYMRSVRKEAGVDGMDRFAAWYGDACRVLRPQLDLRS